MNSGSGEEWNPKWVAFLAERGLTPSEVAAWTQPERIKINADYLCRQVPQRKPIMVDVK